MVYGSSGSMFEVRGSRVGSRRWLNVDWLRDGSQRTTEENREGRMGY